MKGNRNGTICNNRALVIRSGGITRFKFTYHIRIPTLIQKSAQMCLEKEIRNGQLLKMRYVLPPR